jgi:SAM-dependent methyltransferase
VNGEEITRWDGDSYQERFDALAREGFDVHGEAAFVLRRNPDSVLDAGCGSGRVGIEIARHGVTVVGVDSDPSMLATARKNGPDVEWIEHDLTSLSLDRKFSVVLMAGNVPLFTAPGTQRALVAGCRRHIAEDGLLVAGFQLRRGYELAAYDRDCTVAGLELAERYRTWDEQPFTAGSDYAVSVHRLSTENR